MEDVDGSRYGRVLLEVVTTERDYLAGLDLIHRHYYSPYDVSIVSFTHTHTHTLSHTLSMCFTLSGAVTIAHVVVHENLTSILFYFLNFNLHWTRCRITARYAHSDTAAIAAIFLNLPELLAFHRRFAARLDDAYASQQPLACEQVRHCDADSSWRVSLSSVCVCEGANACVCVSE